MNLLSAQKFWARGLKPKILHSEFVIVSTFLHFRNFLTMSQFYQLQLEEVIADYQAGLITATGLVKYYFLIKNSSNGKIVFNAEQVCKELGLGRATLYKAIAKLKKSGWSFETQTQTIISPPLQIVKNFPSSKSDKNP